MASAAPLKTHGFADTCSPPLVLLPCCAFSFRVPEEFLPAEAAALFRDPEVTPCDQLNLVWKDPDEAGLLQFLVQEKGFSLERVQTALKRLKGARGKASQQRIEGFFKMAPAAAASAVKFEKPNAKRKEPPATSASAKKKAAADAKKPKAASKKK